MSVESIMSQSVLNKARKDKFLLVLDVPKVLKDINSNTRSNNLVNLDKIQFSIFGGVVPQVSVPEQSINTYGQAYNITGMTRPKYSPVSVGFNVDNNFDNYWVLWKWLAVLNDPKKSGMTEHFTEFQEMRDTVADNIRDLAKNLNNRKGPVKNVKYKHIKMLNDYTDYQTNVTIFGLREYNEKIVRFDYSNVFITNLGELKYDYKDPSEMDCRFEFVFNQLEVTLLENNTDIKL
jgi:hypothetical protein